MGILASSYQALRNDIYDHVPAVMCKACGECCVSPHMTLIEFCFLMSHMLETPDFLVSALSRTVPEHPDFPGHLMCRFQTADKLCGVYPGRSLACRLHGHPVLEQTGLKYSVHCPKSSCDGAEFKPEDVYGLMDRLTELNQGYYSYYTPPYWVSGLNTESWLSILFSDIEQPLFRLLKKIINRELGIEHLGDHFTQKVPMSRKLDVIDQFQAALPRGDKELLRSLLKRIQYDFPETGAYYYFEADMYIKALDEERKIV